MMKHIKIWIIAVISLFLFTGAIWLLTNEKKDSHSLEGVYYMNTKTQTVQYTVVKEKDTWKLVVDEVKINDNGLTRTCEYWGTGKDQGNSKVEFSQMSGYYGVNGSGSISFTLWEKDNLLLGQRSWKDMSNGHEKTMDVLALSYKEDNLRFPWIKTAAILALYALWVTGVSLYLGKTGTKKLFIPYTAILIVVSAVFIAVSTGEMDRSGLYVLECDKGSLVVCLSGYDNESYRMVSTFEGTILQDTRTAVHNNKPITLSAEESIRKDLYDFTQKTPEKIELLPNSRGMDIQFSDQYDSATVSMTSELASQFHSLAYLFGIVPVMGATILGLLLWRKKSVGKALKLYSESYRITGLAYLPEELEYMKDYLDKHTRDQQIVLKKDEFRVGDSVVVPGKMHCMTLSELGKLQNIDTLIGGEIVVSIEHPQEPQTSYYLWKQQSYRLLEKKDTQITLWALEVEQ